MNLIGSGMYFSSYMGTNPVVLYMALLFLQDAPVLTLDLVIVLGLVGVLAVSAIIITVYYIMTRSKTHVEPDTDEKDIENVQHIQDDYEINVPKEDRGTFEQFEQRFL